MLSIFGHLQQLTFAQWHKVWLEILPNDKSAPKNPKLRKKFQSGEISPNLVTLDAINIDKCRDCK